MGSIDENRNAWRTHDWRQRGDEWSAEWGGTQSLWHSTILPRIHPYVPTGTVLELAPGFGRCTQFVKDLCEHLILVDLADVCIHECQKRFSAADHISYHVNDGKSLAMVPDGTVDFVFSFDSLVHVEADVIEAYLQQLATKLSAHGAGFIHHSNLGAYMNAKGTLRSYIDNEHDGSNWRGASMTAKLFEQQCDRAGLQCVSQELVSFFPRYSLRGLRPEGRLSQMTSRFGFGGLSAQVLDKISGKLLNDCFSVFTRRDGRHASVVYKNTRFMEEVRYAARLADLYRGAEVGEPT